AGGRADRRLARRRGSGRHERGEHAMAVTVTGQPVGRVKPTRLIEMWRHRDDRGRMSVIESEWDTGFPVQRVYMLHHPADGRARGAHAHRELEQVFIAAHGGFTI